MFVAARALSFEEMKELITSQRELLTGHSFISIAPEEARREGKNLRWPANSDRWLSMFFDDVRPEHMNLLPVLEEYHGRPMQLFADDQADEIIRFLKNCQSRPQQEVLYVNCMAGISRSGAIVRFACETFNLDPKKLMIENPQILPNMLVLRLLRKRWKMDNPHTFPTNC